MLDIATVKPIVNYPVPNKMPKNVVQMTPSILDAITHVAHHTLLQSNTYGCSGYPASSRHSKDKKCPNINFFCDHPNRLGSDVQGPEISKGIC